MGVSPRGENSGPGLNVELIQMLPIGLQYVTYRSGAEESIQGDPLEAGLRHTLRSYNQHLFVLENLKCF